MARPVRKKVSAKVVGKNIERPVSSVNHKIPASNTSVENGFGIAGFVLGLAGIFMFFIPVFSVLGFIFSIIQMRKRNTGLTIAGLTLSIIGLVLFMLMVIFFLLLSFSVSGNPGLID